MDFFLNIIFTILMIISFLGAFFAAFYPILPSYIITFIGVLFYLLVKKTESVSFFGLEFYIFLTLLILFMILDFFVPDIYMTKKGCSKRSIYIGTLFSIILGLFFSIFGVIFGFMLGVFIGEYSKTNDANLSFRSAKYSLVSFMLGAGLKLFFLFGVTGYIIFSLCLSLKS